MSTVPSNDQKSTPMAVRERPEQLCMKRVADNPSDSDSEYEPPNKQRRRDKCSSSVSSSDTEESNLELDLEDDRTRKVSDFILKKRQEKDKCVERTITLDGAMTGMCFVHVIAWLHVPIALSYLESFCHVILFLQNILSRDCLGGC